MIDVIVPCQTGRKIDGIRARRCRYPSADELTVHEDVPCTTPSRTLVDLAGTLGRVSLRRAVEEAAVLGLLDLASLDRAVARAKGRRGVPALRAILTSWRSADDRPLRLRSGLEAWLMSAAVGSGLPRPQCNVELQIDGERLEIDLLWVRQRLAVETDGETTHGTGVAFHRDRRRDQILAAAGYRTARVTWRHMEDEPTEVLDRIRHMLEREPVES